MDLALTKPLMHYRDPPGSEGDIWVTGMGLPWTCRIAGQREDRKSLFRARVEQSVLTLLIIGD
eukprot:597530-Pelagomonas_calceolata.AAC.7